MVEETGDRAPVRGPPPLSTRSSLRVRIVDQVDLTGRLLADLTPAQTAAVTSESAPLLVLASAGAGKTRVLTRRIAYRALTKSASADHVLALTFTRKAAGEMLGRLGQLGLHETVTATTFHGAAAAQLRRWWADRRRSPAALLDRKSRLLAPLLADRPGLAGASVAEVAAQIEWAKARTVGPEEFTAAAIDSGRRLPSGVTASDLAALYARYEHEKTRRGLVDFDDLIAGCAEAIERDPSFAAAQRWKWRHLFVDEFQDLNPLQHRLLMAWLGSSTDLCIVGDANQAIYGWNGADPGLLLEVTRRWPATETVRLDENHRCSPEIVRAAASVLGREGAGLASSSPSGPQPTVLGYVSEMGEARATASAVLGAHAEGRPWSSMGVLARTNAQLGPLQEAFSAAGIPFWAPDPPGKPDPTDEAGPSPDRPVVSAAIGNQQGGDGVTLSSFHRAKGLEWEEVWVVGMEAGLVPISHAEGRAAEEEERRLLYVALTRASRVLHCSWARERTFGSRPVPRDPSPWLEAISSATGSGATNPGPREDVTYWRGRLRAQRNALKGRVPGLPDPDGSLIAALRRWRTETARASGVPPYVILHDVTLSALASLRPHTLEQLVKVPGLGPVKASRYGPALMSIVSERPSSADEEERGFRAPISAVN